MLSRHLIREARRRAGLTQAELARRVRTTQSVIARWERGGSQPSVETLQRVLGACGFALGVTLTEVNPDERAQLDRNLALTPARRLDQLTGAARFLRTGRRALARAR